MKLDGSPHPVLLPHHRCEGHLDHCEVRSGVDGGHVRKPGKEFFIDSSTSRVIQILERPPPFAEGHDAERERLIHSGQRHQSGDIRCADADPHPPLWVTSSTASATFHAGSSTALVAVVSKTRERPVP